MASGPISSWQIERETVDAVTDVLFLGSKITADGDCSHGIRRRLLLGRKAMTNLDSVLKSKTITLLTKVYRVKAMFFPVAMYRCESWTTKKAEHWRIDGFKLWCWRRLLSPLDCKEIQPVHPKGDQSWVFIQFSRSVVSLCDPMDHSTPGLPVHHQLPEFTQTHVHWVHDAIQPSYPLSSPSPPAFNLSQHQGVFRWVSSLH